jgi:hypothetical protein
VCIKAIRRGGVSTLCHPSGGKVTGLNFPHDNLISRHTGNRTAFQSMLCNGVGDGFLRASSARMARGVTIAYFLA